MTGGSHLDAPAPAVRFSADAATALDLDHDFGIVRMTEVVEIDSIESVSEVHVHQLCFVPVAQIRNLDLHVMHLGDGNRPNEQRRRSGQPRGVSH